MGVSNRVAFCVRWCGNSFIAEADRHGYPSRVHRLAMLHGGVSGVPQRTTRRVPLPWRAQRDTWEGRRHAQAAAAEHGAGLRIDLISGTSSSRGLPTGTERREALVAASERLPPRWTIAFEMAAHSGQVEHGVGQRAHGRHLAR
jgi:hypothetical protein